LKLTIRSLQLFLVLAVATTLSAADQSRQPWNWTTAQRVVDRYDSQHAADRRAAFGPGLTESASNGPNARQFVLDGRRNPELFMPHELFDVLLTGVAPDARLRNKQRDSLDPALATLGYTSDFWSSLASAAAEYLSIRFPTTSPSSAANDADIRRCTARYEALQRARQTFGAATFDRLLYTVVAPTVTRVEVTTSADPAAALLRAERGCR
jgi:hypothetical protein